MVGLHLSVQITLRMAHWVLFMCPSKKLCNKHNCLKCVLIIYTYALPTATCQNIFHDTCLLCLHSFQLLNLLFLFPFHGFNWSFIISSVSFHLLSPCLSNTGYNGVRCLAACALNLRRSKFHYLKEIISNSTVVFALEVLT